jgi:predicted transporter
MIDLLTALLIAAGFGFLALAGLTLARHPPSPRRLERVVTFTFLGAVLVAVVTALVAQRAFARRNWDLAEWIAMAAVGVCLVFCTVGYPAVRWCAARWFGRRPGADADFADGRDGNPVRLPRE